MPMKKSLNVFQRMMVCFVFGFHYRHHVRLFNWQLLLWLSIPHRVKYLKLVHLFKNKHGLAPQYLSKSIVSVSDPHLHNTRGSVSNFHVSKSMSGTPSAFAHPCVKQWSDPPTNIKSIDNLDASKRELRKSLYSSYG